MRHLVISIVLLSLGFCNAFGQISSCKKANCTDEIALWNLIDGSKKTTRLYTYLPASYDTTDKKTPAVIICPGGSYHHLGMPHEGHQVAQWFVEQGIAAFVLRYRVSSHGAHHPDMIQDIQATITYMKTFADVYKIDTTKIGAIGFSAGGHLVAHAAITKENFIKKEFPASTKYGLRPNFVMPIYPVVSMEDSIAHVRSRKNLLTKNYTEEDIHKFSLEQNVPDDMPPTFILACTDDDVVDIRNSRALFSALPKKNISESKFTEIPVGGHGFGMFKTKSEQTKNWADNLLKHWLELIEVLPTTQIECDLDIAPAENNE
ncbi:MAG: alpha/beta hydrolase [Bacteroidales bacterium]|nr:alpha/beta hydrolase [Bacteroidales bacterium]